MDSLILTIPAVAPPSIVSDRYPSTTTVGVPAVFLITNVEVFPDAVGRLTVNPPEVVSHFIIKIPVVELAL